jgi:DNA-binding phage protein
MKKVELTDFDDSFVKRLSKNSKELAEYKKFVIAEFEKDQNKDLLLEGLTTVAMALSLRNSKTASLAKLKRQNLYKNLDKYGNYPLDSFF